MTTNMTTTVATAPSNATWSTNVTSSNYTEYTTTGTDDVTVDDVTEDNATAYVNATLIYGNVTDDVTATTYTTDAGSRIVDDTTFNTVTLAGSIAAIVCYFCIIVLLFGMGMHGIRSHIHCNVCLSLLCAHILLLVGAQREAETLECKIVSILTQFFILVGLTWLMLEGVHLFRLSMVGSDLGGSNEAAPDSGMRTQSGREKRRSGRTHPTHHRRHDNGQLPNNRGHIREGRNSRENSNKNKRHHNHYNGQSKSVVRRNRCCSRLTSFYFIGWIGPALFIGATVPAALKGYGQANNCWLATGNEVIWVFCAPVPAMFIFHCLAMILSITNYKRKIKQVMLQREMETEITTLDDDREEEVARITESETPVYQNVDPSSRRASSDTSAPTPSTSHAVPHTNIRRLRTYSNATTKQATFSKNSHDVGPSQSGSDSTEYGLRYFEFQDNYDDLPPGDEDNDVTVHPPIYDVRRHTFAVSLPDKELNEPVQHFISAVHWHSILLPLVCITWSTGIVAINFRWVAFNYAFCVLNIVQAVFIFAFYCVVTFRLRHRWYILTAKEVDDDARPITILIGDDLDDACDAINERRMGRKRQRRRKIPNIDLMTRTPTPFNSQRGRTPDEDSNESDSNMYRSRWKRQWSAHNRRRLNMIAESMTSQPSVMTSQPNNLEKESPVTQQRTFPNYISTTAYVSAAAEKRRSSAPSAGHEITQVTPLQQSSPVNIFTIINPDYAEIPRKDPELETRDHQSTEIDDIRDILQSVTPTSGLDQSLRRASAPNASMTSRGQGVASSQSLTPAELGEILSNEPFENTSPRASENKDAIATNPSDSSSRVSSGSGGSTKALLATPVTPPMVLESPLSSRAVSPVMNPRKTYTIEPKSEKPKLQESENYKPILPRPRGDAVHKFSPISVFTAKKEQNLLKSSSEEQSIPEIPSRNSLNPGKAIKIFFRK